MSLIQIQNLSKTYTYYKKEQGLKGSMKNIFRRELLSKKALDSLDLEIEKGEFVGLIGPNGAGKTTLMKILAGILHPDKGSSVNSMGYIPCKLENSYKKRFAVVMGQKSQLWWDLPAMDSFLLHKEIYEIPDIQFKAVLYELSDVLGVADILNVPVRKLSLGQRMKMEIMLSLIQQPELLLLDEPTIGLDGISRKRIRQFLAFLNKEKKVTIILTSHYLEDVRELCSRLVVINNGMKVFDGDTSELVRKYNEYTIFKATCLEPAIWEKWDTLRFPFEWEEDKAVFKVSGAEIQTLGAKLFSLPFLQDITMEQMPIDSIIEKIYEESRDGV